MHPNFAAVHQWLRDRSVATMELHLTRTRFWLDSDSAIYTEFLLRWADSCPLVDPTLDLATGMPLEEEIRDLSLRGLSRTDLADK